MYLVAFVRLSVCPSGCLSDISRLNHLTYDLDLGMKKNAGHLFNLFGPTFFHVSNNCADEVDRLLISHFSHQGTKLNLIQFN